MDRILLLALLFTSASEAQWTVHQAPGDILSGIYFADSLNGWVCGTDGIFRTTNGGDDWELQRPGQAGQMSGFNAQECWATGVGDRLVHTTDGGNSWPSVFLGSALDSISSLGRICFVDSRHGWVTATRGRSSWILRTGDGGASWTAFPIFIGLPGHVLCSFVDTLTGWVAGSSPEIFRTMDGGVTWTMVGYLPSYGVYDIQFLTRGFGWGVSQATVNFTAIAKTTDGGALWSVQHWFDCQPSLSFVDTLWGWAIQDCFSDVEIVHTSDGGISWASQFTYSTFGSQRRIYSVDRSHGWVIGEGGLMFRTTNGGMTPVKADAEETPGSFTLFQNYPNPFNPTTTIKYSLPSQRSINAEGRVGVGSHVKLTVFDILGQQVATLVNEVKQPGTYAVQWDAQGVATGVYLYRLQTGSYSETRKLVVLR